LEERILTPAGMGDTYVGTAEADATCDRAEGYRSENGKLLPDEEKQLERFVAAGGVVSTARDLLAFSEALRSDQLLSAASREKMLSSTEGHRYGCRNVAIPTGDRIQVLQGGMAGTSAFVARVNDGEYTVVALENLTDAPGEPLMREIIELLLRSK
jgi:CubicO group peptidase (beta-lactamase class C family)